MRLRRAGAALLVVALAVPVAVVAAPVSAQVGGETLYFPEPDGAEWGDVAQGPDGNMWFRLCDEDAWGRVNSEGLLEPVPFSDPSISCVSTLQSGPGGTFWFSAVGSFPGYRVGTVDAAGTMTTFTVPVDPYWFVPGSDGNVWIADRNGGDFRIKRYSPQGVMTGDFPVGEDVVPVTPVVASDRIWFATDHMCRSGFDSDDGIGSVTMDGVVDTFCGPVSTMFTLSLAVGRDGSVWLANNGEASRLDPEAADPAASIVTFDLTTASGPIATGPDGNIWFPHSGDSLGRVEMDGRLSIFEFDAHHLAEPEWVAAGPDGAVWFNAAGNEVSNLPGGIGRMQVFNEACNAAPPAGTYPDVPGGAWYRPSVDWADCHAFAGPILGEFRPTKPMRRARLVQMLWTMVDLPGASPSTNQPTHGFPDVPDHKWYNDALDWAAAEGIATALPDGTFAPKRAVRRGELAQMLWRMVGSPEGSPPSGIADVPAGAWYEEGVDWAAEHGLLITAGNGTLKPKQEVTRAQVVAILDRLAHDESAWSAWTDADVTTWRF